MNINPFKPMPVLFGYRKTAIHPLKYYYGPSIEALEDILPSGCNVDDLRQVKELAWFDRQGHRWDNLTPYSYDRFFSYSNLPHYEHAFSFYIHQPDVKKVVATPKGEEIIAYCARVSNPDNQLNENIKGLLKFCMREGHVSVFEQADLTLEINTTRAIAAQILRHWSFHFQEFSQRYQDVNKICPDITICDIRSQDTKNRQNSIDNFSAETKRRFYVLKAIHAHRGRMLYRAQLQAGVAKECARFDLPLHTPTRMYMKGTVRDWIFYLKLRAKNGTQQEHVDITREAKPIFKKEFPIIAQAMEEMTNADIDRASKQQKD